MRIAFATAAAGVVGEWDADRPLHDGVCARAGPDLEHTCRDPAAAAATEGETAVVVR